MLIFRFLWWVDVEFSINFNYCSLGLVSVEQFKRAYTSVMIVPTGVGAAIGGYAGDALPVARALSTVVDCLITHPNVSSSS